VIFTSTLKPAQQGYGAMADKMIAMVSQQKGFLGFDSARGEGGLGITVSYWESRESIAAWKAVVEHREAQARGRKDWYSHFSVRIAEVLEDKSS
jgi:heme-degrading monooxygenase HmoA